MKKSLQESPPRSPGSDSDGNDQVHDQSIVIPGKLAAMDDSFEKKEHSWIITSLTPTDLSIQVQGITFNVHKYPLVSKCGYIHRLELQPSISNMGYDLKLENFPGGSETFAVVLRFCYGLPVDFNSTNIAPLRCASEFLEMTEEFEDGNLIAKTEAFLTFVVLSSWKDTITVIKSCETLSPWAENLQIVRRCCDSIAWKASREISTSGDAVNEEGWWFDYVATLGIDHFIRIIAAIKARGTKPEIIGKCIMHYADGWFPGMDIELGGLRGIGYGKNELQFSVYGGNEEGGIGHSKEQKTIIESLISILPPQQEAVSCKFLFKMLRLAMVCSATPALISELEKRVGMMLEDANVNDLLIPNYRNAKLVNSPEQCEMHDTDVVQRIVEYFLMHEQQQQHQKSGKCNISKLLDNYLAEIARDQNLSITKFQVLAEALPENARTCDDGLYRAIDTYLKTHPLLFEHDRRRLCKIMNCEKLSLDACMHAAQNDRLPLRTVVQVLFSEQVKMRAAMVEKEPAPSGNITEQEGNQSSTDTEIKTLKAELEIVKMTMAELQSDYSDLQREYEKRSHKQKRVSGWSSSWRKIKNSFQAKVDGDETRDEQLRPKAFRRRLSLS
ncbi:BTB/POZ domain-containing protein DOT3 isoform X1 [Juglans microcarpa x Juglans regia]|uniref:BTB/POZ domain-containing protein DOT3 isoform X1 n=1 Tax=Juglans microcarpa x Juglans regia TaxID=2249226 RepID=UPI001B7F3A82|nr:BTB/POZ domain-containing protein DOT3 isoform X1 [Juglans microcarpa x Juglans regia]